jgi:hypothetical protein
LDDYHEGWHVIDFLIGCQKLSVVIFLLLLILLVLCSVAFELLLVHISLLFLILTGTVSFRDLLVLEVLVELIQRCLKRLIIL